MVNIFEVSMKLCNAIISISETFYNITPNVLFMHGPVRNDTSQFTTVHQLRKANGNRALKFNVKAHFMFKRFYILNA